MCAPDHAPADGHRVDSPAPPNTLSEEADLGDTASVASDSAFWAAWMTGVLSPISGRGVVLRP